MNFNDLMPDERLDMINENLSLIQKKDGLTFGTDAFLLASFMKYRVKSAADLGSGTPSAGSETGLFREISDGI